MAKRIDLLEKLPWLKGLVKMRSFQFILMLVNLAFFFLFILTGLFGHPIGNKNIMIIFVWILWWALLIALLVPFGGRIWCTMCPLPGFGEWLQRGALAKVRHGKPLGLNLKWPQALRNIWPQNFGFLLLAMFSALLVTRPIVSVMVLGGMIVLAIVLHLVFQKRSFCLYLCPVSGFLGLYSMCATLELRVKDRDVCRKHKGKECLRGSDKGYGCPWSQYPGNLKRNNYCGLCTECIKTCPEDNIALNLRPFASDDRIEGFDEAWKAFIMLVLAGAYSVTLLGSNGTLKDWANVSMTQDWQGFAIYAGTVMAAALVIFPAFYGLFIWVARLMAGIKEISYKQMFIEYSFVMVPMGLMAWIAFSIPLVLINGSYIISVLSDPFGWGWNLLGTKYFPWTPVLSGVVPYFQVAALLLGLVISIAKGYQVAQRLLSDSYKAFKSLVPVAIMLTVVVVIFLNLYTA